jgi:three-Cys-motif partner protein
MFFSGIEACELSRGPSVKKHTSLGTEAEFFKNLREGSRIKQKIVSEYFVYYNRVMTRANNKVGYADLFAGPGLYVDSEGRSHKSLPILVCEAAIREESIRQKVHLWFNDGDLNNYRELKLAIESLPGVETLQYAPTIQNKIVDAGWAEKLTKLKVPTLIFLDPCGYKGLSLKLVASALGGFGNDCIFFFNYSRINMKLDLKVMDRSIDEFFEPERANALREAIRRPEPRRTGRDYLGRGQIRHQAGGRNPAFLQVPQRYESDEPSPCLRIEESPGCGRN